MRRRRKFDRVFASGRLVRGGDVKKEEDSSFSWKCECEA
jgi:hypothetical protein